MRIQYTDGHRPISPRQPERPVCALSVQAGFASPAEDHVANPTYPDIEPKDGQTVEVWGVVVATIKRMPL